ncbi:MAG: carboxypeptidase-like regulatory domain-containing protein [Nitrososphaerales archaeon]
MLASSIVTVNAEQKIQTTLIIEGVPERAYAGDIITFNGRLVKADNGEGVAKAAIMIKNENASTGAGIIAAGTTDDNGRFSIQWVAESKEKDTFRLHAVYMGTGRYSSSQSENYTIQVERLDLLVQTNKKVYNYDDQLIIFGSGRPHDVLSVFVTTTGGNAILGTKITIDEMGRFSATLLTWGKSAYTEPYLVHVRSTTDLPSLKMVPIILARYEIEQPMGTETVLTLDPPRSNVTYNDNLIFTGKLETKTGLPIMEAAILIKYKDAKDGILAQWITSDDGKFFINWKALQVNSNDFLKVYGSFEGGNGFLPSVSDQHEIKFKPRKLTLDLNKVRFGPNDLLTVSGIAPPGERLNINLIGPEGNAVAAKSVLVYSEESYEKTFMHWTKPSYIFPEGEYIVRGETENSPVLAVSKTLYFEEPKPLSKYKITGSVWYEDSDGNELPLEGIKVKIVSPYGEIESYTDHLGKYVFEDLHSIIKSVKNVFSLTTELDGKYFRLIDASNSKVVSKRIGHMRFDGSLHDIVLEPVVFSGKLEAAAARIFALQSDIVRFYTDAIGLQPKKIDIEIFSKETSKGKYGYEMYGTVPKIWIGKGTSSPRNPYTWDTLAHEYTHYMQDLYASVNHYQSMNHGGYANPTTADSMVEGFADFMSAVISQHHKKEQAGKFLQYSLESNFKVNSVRFLSEELAIAGVFWDIYDDGEDDDDGISLSIKDIWNVMSGVYHFPSYHKDSGVNEMNRNVYYLKDLHYILAQSQDSKELEPALVEELFNNHGIINGFTDIERPSRI